MSTSANGDPAQAPGASRPEGLLQLRVANMAHSLDFYLGLGCEIGYAADGWALLHSAHTDFILLCPAIPGPGWEARSSRRAAAPMPVRLATSNIRALRRRLLAAGVPATINRPVDAPAGEMELLDPDLHPVVIEQSGAPKSTGHAPAERSPSTSLTHKRTRPS